MTGARLIHQAFLYDGPEQFSVEMAPVVRAGVERGDAVMVTAARESLDALRSAVGTLADRVELRDTHAADPRPVERLTGIRRAIADLRPGTSLLALGEPLWSGSRATRREWARCESAINIALADAPLRLVCLYDRARLSEEALGLGLAAHPEVVDRAVACPCATFEAPERFVRGLDAEGAAAVAGDPYEIAFGGDPHAFRDLLAGLARECGLGAGRVADLVLAANEVVTNAVIHGEPPILARCWVADGDFVCEISDGGPGVTDPFAGWTLPPPGAEGGWGLALARRLSDALEVTSDGPGSRVRLYVALDPVVPFAG